MLVPRLARAAVGCGLIRNLTAVQAFFAESDVEPVEPTRHRDARCGRPVCHGSVIANA
jgi:hypothetical protein